MEKIVQYLSQFYRRDKDYPVLGTQDFGKVFSGLRLLDATPLFNNTLTKYLPLLAAGADLTVGLSEKIPYDKALFEKLGELGLKYVWDTEKCLNYDIIFDCAGAFSKCVPRIGTVELTRSGIYHYGNAAFPVILVDDSRIKNIETCLGTGDGFLRGMEKLGYTEWRGKRVVIFGFGKVGRGVAFYLLKRGSEVIAIDAAGTVVPEGVTLVEMNNESAIVSAVHNAYCIVTAIGKDGALRASPAIAEILAGKQIVTKISVEDEWGGALPKERQLAGGATINFLLEEPTQLKYIEATMALSNAAATELILHEKDYNSGINRASSALQSRIWEAFKAKSRVCQEAEDAGL